MYQIRKLRSFTPKGETAPRVFDAPLKDDLLSHDLAELFQNLDDYLKRIPADENWNLFYTAGHTCGGDKRTWERQDIIVFDIDGMQVHEDGSFSQAYIDLAIKELGVDPKKTAIVATGNGMHIIIKTKGEWKERSWFERNKKWFALCLDKIGFAYTEAGLPWKKDTSVFAPNHIFRMPGTINRKPGKPDKLCRLLQPVLKPQPFDLEKCVGLPKVDEKDQVGERQLQSFAVDVQAVEDGCEFLKWMKANPEEMTEPLYYAMLSIVARLKGPNETEVEARKKAHAYSEGSSKYDSGRTDQKIDHALAGSGPRTCKNIEAEWGGCSGCQHYGKISSPICIKSDDFIATEHNGFYVIDEKGRYIPRYDDITKFFNRETPYRTSAKSGMVYVFGGQNFNSWSNTQLRNYAHEKFNPKPQERVVNEFVSWVTRTNIVDPTWFYDTIRHKINFQNGILDTKEKTLIKHSPEYPFLYTLPFAYDPTAEAPHFKKFLAEVTMNDKDLQELLLEYVGYAICSHEYWLQKAILLVGEGSNGKSTFLKIIEKLAGRDNVSFLSLSELQSETGRIGLEGKLINMSDELPSYTFRNTEMFKKLMGGSTTARKLYHDSITLECNTKFIFSCNDIPPTRDTSKGLFRRLVIVPFSATFDIGKNADVHILKRITPELPGIFNLVYSRYQRMKTRGYLVESAKANKENEMYRDAIDDVGRWIRDNVGWNGSWDEAAPSLEIDKAFERYFTDAKRSEERPCSKYHFTRHLKRHIDHWDERYTRVRAGTGVRPYIIRGAWLGEHKPEPERF